MEKSKNHNSQISQAHISIRKWTKNRQKFDIFEQFEINLLLQKLTIFIYESLWSHRVVKLYRGATVESKHTFYCDFDIFTVQIGKSWENKTNIFRDYKFENKCSIPVQNSGKITLKHTKSKKVAKNPHYLFLCRIWMIEFVNEKCFRGNFIKPVRFHSSIYFENWCNWILPLKLLSLHLPFFHWTVLKNFQHWFAQNGIALWLTKQMRFLSEQCKKLLTQNSSNGT